MKFIVAETGEEREVRYEEDGIDSALDVAIACGLFYDDSVVYENEAGEIIAPLEDVEFWEDYFKRLKMVDSELGELKAKYGSDEVMDIYYREMGDGCDIETLESAIETIRSTLEERYNLETARLIGIWGSNLPTTDFRYYKESLYQQDTGEFFIVGEGGPMSGYGQACGKGSIGWGECTYSISKAKAEKWIAEHQDD